jgi:membrane fusion protein (multidrug efflux system)
VEIAMPAILRSASINFGPVSSALLADGTEAPPRPRASTRKTLPRRHLAVIGGGLLLLLAALWFGINWFTTGRFIESTDDAYVGGDITTIAPKISGIISQIAITDNQTVHAGDLLVKIDDRDFIAAAQKAQAAVAGDQAALANLAATRTLQLSLIAEAQAQTAASAAQTELAAANQTRYRRLAATNAGSVQDSQTADATWQEAKADQTKSAAALAAAQAQLAVIDTQTQATQAALAGAQADLAAAKLNLGYTQILSPIDGVVGNRSAHLGAYASAGDPLISIVPLHGLWVDANFKEDQLAAIRPGEPVTIRADIDPGLKITGHVASIAPASGAVFSILPAENATGNFTKIVQRVPVRILLDGDAASIGLLRPGLSVIAAINTNGHIK